MIISRSPSIEQEEKLLPFAKGKSEKMRFGFRLLKKLGRSFAVVMNHQKWADHQSFLKILMGFRLKCIGLMIMKLNKKSFSIF
jgi:hypothetical protein